MTIDALPRKVRRSSKAAAPGAESLPIGEIDANIFDCPSCRRPLAAGASRCAGCGQRLLAGVQLGRAAGFLAVGALAGLLVGGGGMAVVGALSQPATQVPSVPVASAVPTVSAAPASALPVPSQPVVQLPTIPAASLSALRQTTTLNDRLVIDAGRLSAALAAAEPSAAELARVLRNLSSNASFGARLAPDLADWTDGTTLSAGLTTLYGEVGAIASEGLSASIRNPDAYVNAAQRMLAVLEGVGALDAEARVLAGEAGIELPPLSAPPAAASAAT